MFIDGLVIGLILGKIRKGKFSRLIELDFRHIWLIVAAFVIQYGSIFIYPKLLPAAVQLSYFFLLLFGFFNRSKPGFILMSIGIALNLTVMLANGGRMPVELEAARNLAPNLVAELITGEYGKHIAMSHSTHLNFLGDLIYLRSPYPHPTIISLGDLVFAAGNISFLQKIMLNKLRPKEVSPDVIIKK